MHNLQPSAEPAPRDNNLASIILHRDWERNQAPNTSLTDLSVWRRRIEDEHLQVPELQKSIVRPASLHPGPSVVVFLTVDDLTGELSIGA